MRLERPVLILAYLACGALVCAQDTPTIPSWLTAYPGASEQTRRLGPVAESNYTTAAAPRDVLSHLRQLFATAGVPFQPSAGGNGFMIRASVEECDLYIRIRRMDTSTAVQVTCAAGPGRGDTQRALEKADQTHRGHIDSMEKYDRPVYPEPKRAGPPMPPLVWPAWLVRTDGARLNIQKGINGVRKNYLQSSFLSAPPRNNIVAYYADLLTANGYRVYLRSLDATPQNRKAWVEGALELDGRPGRRFVIRIDLTPVNDVINVELRMTAYP